MKLCWQVKIILFLVIITIITIIKVYLLLLILLNINICTIAHLDWIVCVFGMCMPLIKFIMIIIINSLLYNLPSYDISHFSSILWSYIGEYRL